MGSLTVFYSILPVRDPNFKGTDYGKEKEKESRKDPKDGGDSRTKKMVDSPLYHLFDFRRYSGDRGYFILTAHLTDSFRRGGSDINGFPPSPALRRCFDNQPFRGK